MKVLVIGNGGREHAIAWKLAQSPKVQHVFVAPGNAGTAQEPNVENIAIAATDIPALITFAKQENIDLTVVGPEAPLAAGIVDQFQQQQLACFGPNQQAAQLEASKAFSKNFMQRHGIPTAKFAQFTNPELAKQYVAEQAGSVVIKADGLAAGKGVIIAHTQEQANQAIDDILNSQRFGLAGTQIVIEEFLQGEEASFIVMVDGKTAKPFATSQDHKARDNGDHGPNTGGMGAYSPAPVVTQDIEQRVMQQIVQPTVAGLASEGIPYTGFLYVGLMIAPDGQAKVLEYNCRLGDPETQPLLMRLTSDLFDLCIAALNQQLDQCPIEWDPRCALGVVLCAGGYPEDYAKGNAIEGINKANTNAVKVFHAGTRHNNQQVLTNGGRVLCVTALGDNVTQAQALAYQQVQHIYWDKIYYRTDIGYRAIAREQVLEGMS